MPKTSRPFPELAAVQSTRKGERNPDLEARSALFPAMIDLPISEEGV
jgi:hypothetical protein